MGLFSRISFITLLLLLTQMLSCVNTSDFLPLNPCDPLYQGDQICGARLSDSGMDQNGRPDGEIPDSGNLEDRDSGEPATLPCLDGAGSILPGWCLIGDTCHQAGGDDGEGGCGYCDPDQSTHTWTNREDGTLCTITGEEGTDDRGETRGRCEEGRCLINGCECSPEGFCCDGCHPVNQGEECFHDDLECTRYVCTDQGRCEQEVLDGWCLTDRNRCHHTMNDPNHCGTCDRACGPEQICTHGECVRHCVGGLAPCGEVCVDLLSDPSHCGRCDRECLAGEICAGGECTLDCAPGLTPCHDLCVNLNQDQDHCGECFHQCDPGTVCEQGRCIIKVEGVDLNLSRLTLNIGETYQLTALVHPEDATDQGLTWSTGDRTVALVTDEGLVTGMGKGQTEITVTTRHGGHTSSVPVRVGRAVTGVTLDHTYLSLSIGEIGKLTQSVSPPDADDPTVFWTSDNGQVVEVDQDGNLLARAYGEARITVTTTDGGWTDHCQIVVTAVPVTGVTVTPGEITLGRGATATLTATVIPGHATVRTIIWTSSDEETALVANGQITANRAGQATITATSVDGMHQAHCQVTVVVPVTGIELDPNPLWVPPGATEQLVITILPGDATNQEVTCRSENQAVATIGDHTGLVTGTNPGQTRIICTTGEGGFEAGVTVHVGIRVTGIGMSTPSLTLQPGESHTLIATISPPDATHQTIIWTTNNPAVATITPHGEVGAVSPGQAVIAATTEGGSYQATCTVAVQILATEVTITPPSLNMVARRTGELTALVTPPNITDQEVFWSSSNPEVATVDSQGLVTGISEGEVTITATTADGGQAATAPITVLPAGTPDWSAGFGGPGNDYATSVAVDVDGNVFITGYYNSRTLHLGDYTLGNNGYSDLFLAKFSPEGECLWGKTSVGLAMIGVTW